MAVTQKDLAAALGMSRSMVALALSGHPKVSAKTREKVEYAARELGYSAQSNVGARALAFKRHGRRARSGAIAVIFQAGFGGRSLRSWPYYTPYFAAIEEEGELLGLDVVFLPVRTQGAQRLLEECLVDGVISLANNHLTPLLSELDMPQVLVDNHSAEIPSLHPAEREGIRLATEHLISLGHRRIAYVGQNLDFRGGHERFAGYREAMVAAGLTPDPRHVLANLMAQTEGIEDALQTLLQKCPPGTPAGFTAIVCYNDLMATTIAAELERLGLRVPGDISITGFDGLWQPGDPGLPLTSVAFDRDAVARRAVRLLCRMVDAQQAGQGLDAFLNQPEFPVQLQVHASTVAPRSS